MRTVGDYQKLEPRYANSWGLLEPRYANSWGLLEPRYANSWGLFWNPDMRTVGDYWSADVQNKFCGKRCCQFPSQQACIRPTAGFSTLTYCSHFSAVHSTAPHTIQQYSYQRFTEMCLSKHQYNPTLMCITAMTKQDTNPPSRSPHITIGYPQISSHYNTN